MKNLKLKRKKLKLDRTVVRKLAREQLDRAAGAGGDTNTCPHMTNPMVC